MFSLHIATNESSQSNEQSGPNLTESQATPPSDIEEGIDMTSENPSNNSPVIDSSVLQSSSWDDDIEKKTFMKDTFKRMHQGFLEGDSLAVFDAIGAAFFRLFEWHTPKSPEEMRNGFKAMISMCSDELN